MHVAHRRSARPPCNNASAVAVAQYPRISDVALEGLTFTNCSSAPYLLFINGIPDAPVTGVRATDWSLVDSITPLPFKGPSPQMRDHDAFALCKDAADVSITGIRGNRHRSAAEKAPATCKKCGKGKARSNSTTRDWASKARGQAVAAARARRREARHAGKAAAAARGRRLLETPTVPLSVFTITKRCRVACNGARCAYDETSMHKAGKGERKMLG
jgi:hypothetical protein